MEQTTIVRENNHYSPKGIVVKQDPQEKEFEYLIKLWVKNEIAYETLMNNFPDLYVSRWKKIVRQILSLLN